VWGGWRREDWRSGRGGGRGGGGRWDSLVGLVCRFELATVQDCVHVCACRFIAPRGALNIPLLQIPYVLRSLLRIRNHLNKEVCKRRATELRILAPIQIPVIYALLVRWVPQSGPLTGSPTHRFLDRALRLLWPDRSCRRGLRSIYRGRVTCGICGCVKRQDVGHVGAAP
jgi:hypothetical protein